VVEVIVLDGSEGKTSVLMNPFFLFQMFSSFPIRNFYF